jgi:hypothetical protein
VRTFSWWGGGSLRRKMGCRSSEDVLGFVTARTKKKKENPLMPQISLCGRVVTIFK